MPKKLEIKAFRAAKDYLKHKKEVVNQYYLEDSGLDIETDLYRFYIKHTSTFRNTINIYDESYKNGVIYYNIKKIKLFKFHPSHELINHMISSLDTLRLI